jgi:hypothetical protein
MSPELTTGELRGTLQPVRLASLLADVTDGSTMMPAGSVVAIQFWGNGKIAVTDWDGRTAWVVAHELRVTLEPHLELRVAIEPRTEH